jgi:hypothetical protein
MFDTVGTWLPYHKAPFMKHIAPLAFSKVDAEGVTSDGMHYLKGRVGNLRVNLNDYGIGISGSYPKYLLEDNVQELGRNETELIVEKLSDEFHLPLENATITRLDVAANLLMSYPAAYYYPYLGDAPYLNRRKYGDSLYYENKSKTLLFYSKDKEAQSKKIPVPEFLNGKNILRAELRLKKPVAQKLKRDSLQLKQLYEYRTYHHIINAWKSNFDSITRLNELVLADCEVRCPKDFWRLLKVYAVDQIGFNQLLEQVDGLRQKGIMKPEYYSRIKKQIKDVYNDNRYSIEHHVIEELDKKFENAAKCYR